jgi:hypothetical protein
MEDPYWARRGRRAARPAHGDDRGAARAELSKLFRRRTSPPRARLQPLFPAVFGIGGMLSGALSVPPAGGGGGSSDASAASKTRSASSSPSRAGARAGSQPERFEATARVLRGKLLFRDMGVEQEQALEAGDSYALRSVGKWVDEALAGELGVTRGWLLHLVEERHAWQAQWVTLDPSILRVTTQQHRHQYAEGGRVREYELRAGASVLLTGNTTAEGFREALHTFRVQTPDAELLFCAADERVADRWVDAFRQAVPRRRSCQGPACRDHCQDNRWRRAQRARGRVPDRVDLSAFASTLPRAPPMGRFSEPLHKLDQRFFYEHWPSPRAEASLRDAARRETKGALDAAGAVYAPILLPAAAAAAPRATDWDVQLKSDPAFCATRIQSAWRASRARAAREVLQRERRAACLDARRPRPSKHLQRLAVFAPRFADKKATSIQRLFRGFCVRVLSRRRLAARAVVIQRVWRRRLRRKGALAVAIQRLWRGRRGRVTARDRRALVARAAARWATRDLPVRLAQRRAAAGAIQRRWRARQCRRRFLARRRLVVRVQARVRAAQLHAGSLAHIERRHLAATRLQAAWRGRAAAARYRRALLAYKVVYKVVLSRVVLSSRRRARVRRSSAAVRVQAWVRAVVARRRYRRQRLAAVVVHALGRMAGPRAALSSRRRASVRVQAFARRLSAQLLLRRARGAAVMIQTAARGRAARALRARRRAATVTLQGLFRLARARRTARRLRTVRKAQAYVRRVQARRRYRAALAVCLRGFTVLQARARGAHIRAGRGEDAHLVAELFRASFAAPTELGEPRQARLKPSGRPVWVSLRSVPDAEFPCWLVELRGSGLSGGGGPVERACKLHADALYRIARLCPPELARAPHECIRVSDLASCVCALACRDKAFARMKALEAAHARGITVRRAAEDCWSAVLAGVAASFTGRVARTRALAARAAEAPGTSAPAPPLPPTRALMQTGDAVALWTALGPACELGREQAPLRADLTLRALSALLLRMLWLTEGVDAAAQPDAQPGDVEGPATAVADAAAERRRRRFFLLARAVRGAALDRSLDLRATHSAAQLLASMALALKARTATHLPDLSTLQHQEPQRQPQQRSCAAALEPTPASAPSLRRLTARLRADASQLGTEQQVCLQRHSSRSARYEQVGVLLKQRGAESPALVAATKQQLAATAEALSDKHERALLHRACQARAAEWAEQFNSVWRPITLVDEIEARRGGLLAELLGVDVERAAAKAAAAQASLVAASTFKSRLEACSQERSRALQRFRTCSHWVRATFDWLQLESARTERECAAVADGLAKHIERLATLHLELLGHLASRNSLGRVQCNKEIQVREAQLRRARAQIVMSWRPHSAVSCSSVKAARVASAALTSACNEADMLFQDVDACTAEYDAQVARIAGGIASVVEDTSQRAAALQDRLAHETDRLDAACTVASNFWWWRYAGERASRDLVRKERERIARGIVHRRWLARPASPTSSSSGGGGGGGGGGGSGDSSALSSDGDDGSKALAKAGRPQLLSENAGFFELALKNRQGQRARPAQPKEPPAAGGRVERLLRRLADLPAAVERRLLNARAPARARAQRLQALTATIGGPDSVRSALQAITSPAVLQDKAEAASAAMQHLASAERAYAFKDKIANPAAMRSALQALKATSAQVAAGPGSAAMQYLNQSASNAMERMDGKELLQLRGTALARSRDLYDSFAPWRAKALEQRRRAAAVLRLQRFFRVQLARKRVTALAVDARGAARVHHAACVLQGLVRLRGETPQRIKEAALERLLKVRAADGRCYYYNAVTGMSSWGRPRVLARFDIDMPEATGKAFSQPAFLEETAPSRGS